MSIVKAGEDLSVNERVREGVYGCMYIVDATSGSRRKEGGLYIDVYVCVEVFKIIYTKIYNLRICVDVCVCVCIYTCNIDKAAIDPPSTPPPTPPSKNHPTPPKPHNKPGIHPLLPPARRRAGGRALQPR